MTNPENQPPAVVNEPLQDSAALALAWSRQECARGDDGHPGCAWYHGAWQMLRYLGVFHSILSDDDFFLPALARLVEAHVLTAKRDVRLAAVVSGVDHRHSGLDFPGKFGGPMDVAGMNTGRQAVW